MPIVSRATIELVGSLAIMGLAFLVLIASAIVVPPIIGGLLLSGALTIDLIGSGFGDARDNWRFMPVLFLWFLAALPIAIHNFVCALSAIDDPSPRAAAKLVLLSLAILAVCPFIWLGF